jgi:F-box domain
MGDQEVKKQCFDSESGHDFISNLPPSLKENIMMRLNIMEVVRTCILSTRWRYTWCTLPKLVILSAHFSEVGKDRNLDCNKFVDSLLTHHKGPITEFILSIENFHYDDLDRWIHILGNKGVKDLCFKFDMMDSCEIPSSFLSRLFVLTNLKFRSRTLDVPQPFKGLKLLRTLELDIATIAGTDLERLVSRCPILQYLKLVNEFESFGNLVIQSQSLERVDIFANFKLLVLDTPKLFALDIEFDSYPLKYEKSRIIRSSHQTYPEELLVDFLMVKFLNCVHHYHCPFLSIMLFILSFTVFLSSATLKLRVESFP